MSHGLRVIALSVTANGTVTGMEDRTCLNCGRPLTGRADQRYCSARCRVAANRDAKCSSAPKRRRRPLWETLRSSSGDVFRAMGRLTDITRDDRYWRSRDEMNPQIRNSLLHVLRQAARELRTLEEGEPTGGPSSIEDGKTYPVRPAKPRAEALRNQAIGVRTAGQLRDHLVMTQGSDGPVDDLSELVAEIDAAIVGLVDAREWITRSRGDRRYG